MINYGIRVRTEVMNVDDVFGFGSLIYQGLKFVNGSINGGKYDGWLSSTNKNGYIEPTRYAQNVISSPAAQAISSIQKKKLDVNTILRLRKAATVTCSNSVSKNPCNLAKGPCLFDIYEDPCEENNLTDNWKYTKALMELRYKAKVREAVPSRRRKPDEACDPINFNLNWNWWQKDSKAF
jgi:arylsulfatase B